jgi:ribosome-associated toxin RatA of RatAB toxin-antitoxin module
MRGTKQSIEIAATPEQVWDVIVDFESYPSFVPNQTGATVIRRGDDRWRVEFELSIAKKLRYTLDLEGERGRTLRWHLVDGDMMKENEGGWLLEALPDGRTRVTYDIAVELKGFVPASVTNLLVAQTLPANLEAFKSEAARRA